jgi:transposase
MLKLTRTNIEKENGKDGEKAKIYEKIIYVGDDVHHKQWNITVLGQERILIKGKVVVPDPKALIEYLRRKIDFEEIIIAYEAGFCGFWIYREFKKLGIKVLVVNPADIPTTDKDNKQKTDMRDSMKIAVALRAGLLHSIYVPTIQEEEEQSLLRRRIDLIEKQTRIKVQIKSFIKKHGINLTNQKGGAERWNNEYITQLSKYAKSNKGLQKQIESMLRELEFILEEIKSIGIDLEKLSEREERKSDYMNLLTIPGIGKVIAITILLELYNIERFNSFSQFASYIGLIPTEHSSGEKQRQGRMTKRGKTKLKSLIIESSWIAIQRDDDFRKYYGKLVLRMKPQKAIIRCARKLLLRIYHILKKKEVYKINKAA